MMKRMMMPNVMVAAALLLLTACDVGSRANTDKERADSHYRSAMDDYRAGRLDAAIDGFMKVVRRDPLNASARFQLACLLQDAKNDPLGAFCNYREYLLQRPDSDKSLLANDRLAKCERELARLLADKHGLLDKGTFAREYEAMKADLKSAEDRANAAEKDAQALRAEVSELKSEQQRLLAVVKGVHGGDTLTHKGPSRKEVKDLLEEDDGVDDRIAISSDAAKLRAEVSDDLSSGSSLLEAHTNVPSRVSAKPKQEMVPPTFPQIPETHVVQEGDTLYGISKRYYGRLSVWKKIREMNKELISSDNRLHVGDTLKLPR